MLKMREPTDQQQLGEPTELPTQKRQSSLVGRFLKPIFSIALVVVLFWGLSASGLLADVFPDISPPILEPVIFELTLAALAIITAVLIGKVIERRSLAEVGLGRHGLLRHTLLGFGIATVAIVLYFLALISVALVGLVPEAADGAANEDTNLLFQQLEQAVQQAGGVFVYLGLTFVFTCLIAVYEEIVFRGLLFRILEKGVGSWLALATTSLLFGMAHIGNPGIHTLISVAPQIAGGMSLAAAYMLTHKLWLPIGIHWFWDFLLFAPSGGLLGLPDASSGAGTSDLPATASLIISIPELVVAVVLLALVIRRGQIHTPSWMQRKRTPKKPYCDVDESAAALLIREEKAVDKMAAL